MAYVVRKSGYENCPLKKRPFQLLDLNSEEVKETLIKTTVVKKGKCEPQDLSVKSVVPCETPPPSPPSDTENRFRHHHHGHHHHHHHHHHHREQQQQQQPYVVTPAPVGYSPVLQCNSYASVDPYYGHKAESAFVPYSGFHTPFYAEDPRPDHRDLRHPATMGVSPGFQTAAHAPQEPLQQPPYGAPLSPQVSPPLFLDAPFGKSCRGAGDSGSPEQQQQLPPPPRPEDDGGGDERDEEASTAAAAAPKGRECHRFQCEQCQKNYSTLAGLAKHRHFHCRSDEPKSFGCRHCEKLYTSLGALKMHIRTHTLPCKCQFCGKAFSRPWLLQGHIRTHTGEKPFSCSQCQRSFADRSNLRAHLQTHSEVKKYSCKRCGKTFSRLSLLVKHEDNGCPGKAATSS